MTLGPPSNENRSYRVDFAKIQTAPLGFAPQWDLVRGVREIGLDAATVEDRRYTRLKQIHNLLEQGLIGKDLRCQGG